MHEQNTEFKPTLVELGSGVYKDYATHIMTHYPFSYFRYYLLPNCKQVFYPPAVCVAKPSLQKFKPISDYYNIDEEKEMLPRYNVCGHPKYELWMQILHLIMWTTIVAIGVAALLKRKKITFSAHDKIVFWGLFSFAAVFYASSIFATPMEIRYLISMHSIQFVCCYMLLNKLLCIKKEKIETKTILYIVIIFIVILLACVFFRPSQKTKIREMQAAQIEALRNSNNLKMNGYIEACEFFKSLPDSVLVITRKPEIFSYYSGKKKAESFPYDGEPDTLKTYLKERKATHVILDDRYRYAYLTLYPMVQKYPEKFKVLKQIGEVDTAKKINPTYVLEFNDEWGYYGERVDGKKTGEGYELFQDGRKYVGEFSNNMPNGYGTLYDSEGKVIGKGEWRNGVMVKAN
jgi:hypothetical protein